VDRSNRSPIIVGAGLAGLWTAWRLAHAGRRVVLLTKKTLIDSASAWAQGGIAAAVGPGDSPAQHAADTLAAADGWADPDAVRILTTEGPERIAQLLALGARFDRDPNGQLGLGLEGAHSRPRILHAGGDRTGAMLVRCLTHLVADEPRITVMEHTEVVRVITEGDRVAGVVAAQRDGSALTLTGPVVLATGGVGQLYAITTNPVVATGDGWALAAHAGAGLRDLEFLQFHPTALRLPGVNPAPLISEAVRGAGAILVDRNGHRFAADADPRAELAPRDVLAQAVAAADEAGGAWLDARGIADFPARFPGVTALLQRHGLHPQQDLLPVAPAMHYAMGGIATDLNGRSSLPGLWAVGEVACTGVHGANRLASNSLLEAIVFADRVARDLLSDHAHGVGTVAAAEPLAESGADAAYASVLHDMREVMTSHVGVVRTERSLLHARRTVAALAASVPPAAWRTKNQLMVARLIVNAALRRRETRGSHARADFPRTTRRARVAVG